MQSKFIFYTALVILGLSSCSKPISNFMLEKKGNKVPADVEFTNASEEAETYLWEFGDGNTSTEESPKHRYYLSGKYNVKLKAIKGGKSTVSEKEIYFEAPDICLVEMQTSMGTMLIQLYDETPLHRDNFLKLSEEKYYDDLLFHRVINGFMIQGGDPDSKNAKEGAALGMGGPSYTIEAEFNPDRVHLKGALAAARQGDNVNPQKRSSGSQFYIVHGKPVPADRLKQIGDKNGITYSPDIISAYTEKGGTPFLDNGYTVFGMVINGFEVIDKIAEVEKDSRDRPKEDVKILSIKVIK